MQRPFDQLQAGEKIHDKMLKKARMMVDGKYLTS